MVKTYSHGEYTINCFLPQHDVVFEYQKRFIDLRDKRPLPCDFYLPHYNLIVEYQGEQHFYASPTSRNAENIEEIKKRDNIKKTYAEKNIVT